MLSQAQACANALILIITDMYLGDNRSFRLKYRYWRDGLELVEMSVSLLVDTDHSFHSTCMC